MSDRPQSGEGDIIERYFAPLAADTPGAFNLTDDAGLINPPDGMDIVMTTDVIVSGVHFLDQTTPEDVAYKALAVNVSDLCAKGAEPAVYLLSLSLPGNPDPAWLGGLRHGLAEAQDTFGCTLLGGDTVATPGPVTLSITAAGFVPEGRMVHRDGAGEGDTVYVTGTIGDAVLGLKLFQPPDIAPEGLSDAQRDFLRNRYLRPRPRLASIEPVRLHTSASMDVSDGLVGDFVKLCRASSVGGIIEADKVPLSDAATLWVEKDSDILEELLSGGDDYEILQTVPETAAAAFEDDCRRAGVDVTAIGRIVAADEGVRVRDGQGNEIAMSRKSYAHF
ncbi:MAG: thiamine-phosphate kinase [Hyphomicrobiaceae bacterium]|nr:thiamine-phosphate kinase [Hyphomicrobiaceae bacterium]